MKKTISLVAAVALTASALAQVGTLTLRSEGKALATGSYQSTCFSLDTTSLLFEQNASLVNARYELARFDMNQKELARIRYKRQAGRSYDYVFDNGTVVDLLISDLGLGDTPPGLYHERRDPANLKPLSDPEPLHTIQREAGQGICFARLSPDKQLVAGFYITLGDGKPAEVRVALYNRKLEEYWNMTSRLTTIGPMMVTDSGEVLIAGCSQKKGTDETVYEVLVFDGEHDNSYRFTTHHKGRVSDLQLASYHNGKIALFATISKEGHTNKNESYVDRLLSLCYNTQTKTLSDEIHKLTDVECNRLGNKDDDARAKNAVRFLQIENVATAPDGRYDVLLTQRWREYVDGLPTGIYTQGLMVASIDANGRFAQTYTRRVNTGVAINQSTMNQYKLMRTAHGALLFFTQHASSADRGEDERVKRFQPMHDKTAITTLYIPDNGSVVEQNFPVDKYGILGTPVSLGNNSYLLFLRTKKKSQVAIFEMDASK